jgi:hypothetical protein
MNRKNLTFSIPPICSPSLLLFPIVYLLINSLINPLCSKIHQTKKSKETDSSLVSSGRIWNTVVPLHNTKHQKTVRPRSASERTASVQTTKVHLRNYFFPSKMNVWLNRTTYSLSKYSKSTISKRNKGFTQLSKPVLSNFHHSAISLFTKTSGHAPRGTEAKNTQEWAQMQFLGNYMPSTNLYMASFSLPWLRNEIITHSPWGHKRHFEAPSFVFMPKEAL